ncbi:predicted protein [Phaeodactylum tricornutum CCAP 1055/1]|jgi:hypothetical protein|uniref:Uncharacterized protein n=2 Tax=Phaeodactylum tricornutum TaxID=2850 RepID=B7GAE0_PHATC|nr:predicted protein [Phaeodactylum tricornutum CCAP 1055/1]EEC44356.1 predicted protein [Phaeodactylum tricornutum CCAP 1055/1]|mmetsp:Transcript_86612/g.232235  ORF Transcript_86612/g.232235 Transcript_86612/m.232235 type:complete len:212 (-) Transcript_86612:6-641(-)|eukprot:XP_002184178.1 predicted protein [Phaeodactylum tricornutum CCAP 1055/1]
MTTPSATNDKKTQEMTPLRDFDELEGTLLPTAQAVLENDRSQFASVPTAVPISHVEYVSDVSDKEEKIPTVDGVALAVPLPTSSSQAQIDHDRLRFQQGTQKGLILSEEEKDRIKYANIQVNAIDYNIRRQVEEANRVAREQNFKEETGQVQSSTAASMQKKPYVPQPTPKAPEFYKGTYGSDYKVKKYDVAEYKPDYQYKTTEYKSVYEP